jgi:4-methylaminobutanoate oxidase (formaldehyde-forming)
LRKFLCGFTVDDPNIILLGRETIHRNGERAGWLSSGGFGHTLGLPIGYGYVRNEAGLNEAYLQAGNYTLEVATTRIPARLHLTPLHDPDMTRVKS